MIDRARELARISAIRDHKICIPMEFYTSNGYEIADVFPMKSMALVDLKKAYRAVCDKFGAVNIDCCSSDNGIPRITVLRRTRNAEHHYIAIYTE